MALRDWDMVALGVSEAEICESKQRPDDPKTNHLLTISYVKF